MLLYFDIVFLCFLAGTSSCQGWIAGHFSVHWGGVRVDVRLAGRKLAFPRDEGQIRRLGICELL